MHSSIQLVALDMDGTLLNSSKQLPADFIDWVRNHPSIQTVISSGRQYYNLVSLFEPVKDQLIYISDNGGYVFEQDQMIYSNAMTNEDIRECLSLLSGVDGLSLILCGAKSAYMYHASSYIEENAHMYYGRLQFVTDLDAVIGTDCIAKIAIFVDDHNAENVYHNFPFLNERITPILSGDSWIDISNRSVSKGAAVTALLQRLCIPSEHAMAFGDYLNDYTLLQSCGESYAMANAHPDLKAIAKHVTASNDEDGVMKILRTL